MQFTVVIAFLHVKYLILTLICDCNYQFSVSSVIVILLRINVVRSSCDRKYVCFSEQHIHVSVCGGVFMSDSVCVFVLFVIVISSLHH